ncbi:putative histone deacetylase complex subunit SAP30/SAP30 [Helianthus anomalus]
MFFYWNCYVFFLILLLTDDSVIDNLSILHVIPIVLTNGIEVKLQRNALSVIEALLLVMKMIMMMILSLKTVSRTLIWKIDLRKLEMAALHRYWLHFNPVSNIMIPKKCILCMCVYV